MARSRDISDSQFRAALRSHGMTEFGMMGYVNLGESTGNSHVSMLNANTLNRRAILAYLLREQEICEKRHAERIVKRFQLS